MTPTTDTALSGRNLRALIAILTAVLLATLDTAIANTALPAIAADLHAAPAASIWVINAYQLAMVATILPLAALGDIVGHRRIYLGGLAVFTFASLVCALATSLPTLAAARAFQGLGASGIMSVNAALRGPQRAGRRRRLCGRTERGLARAECGELALALWHQCSARHRGTRHRDPVVAAFATRHARL
jgi:MFS family permease